MTRSSIIVAVAISCASPAFAGEDRSDADVVAAEADATREKLGWRMAAIERRLDKLAPKTDPEAEAPQEVTVTPIPNPSREEEAVEEVQDDLARLKELCHAVNDLHELEARAAEEPVPNAYVCEEELKALEDRVAALDVLFDRVSYAGANAGIGLDIHPVPGHWLGPNLNAEIVWGAETGFNGYVCAAGAKASPNLFSVGAGFNCATYRITKPKLDRNGDLKKGRWAHGLLYGGSVTDLASGASALPYYGQRAYTGSIGSYNRVILGQNKKGATYLVILGKLNGGVMQTAPGADPDENGFNQGFLGLGFALKIQRVRFNEDDSKGRREER